MSVIFTRKAPLVRAGTPPQGGGLWFTADAGFNLSGADMNDGTVITLTDVNNRFGTKSPVLPLFFWDFATSLNPHATYSRTSTNAGVTFNGTRVATPVPLNAPGATSTDMTSSSNTAGAQVNFGNKTQVYRALERYYNWDFSADGIATNLKSFRLVDDIFSNNSWINEADYAGGHNPGYGNIIGGQGFFQDIPVPPISAWVTNEFEYQRSSGADVNDGYRNYIRDGIHMATPNRAEINFGGGGSFPNPYTTCNLDQISNNAEPAGSKVFTASEYLDDSFARVIWSTESSYADTTTGANRTRQNCIPLTWSAGQITFYTRKGKFPSLSGKHLYVVTTGLTKLHIGSVN